MDALNELGFEMDAIKDCYNKWYSFKTGYEAEKKKRDSGKIGNFAYYEEVADLIADRPSQTLEHIVDINSAKSAGKAKVCLAINQISFRV